MKTGKYTIRGDAAFDEMLEKHLNNIAKAIKESAVHADIAAIVLGGGYGRGEGGVFKCANGNLKLYNDLDFFVIAKNVGRKKLKKIDKATAAIGDFFSRETGVDVDFGPAKTLKQLLRMPFTMMWQELREGHVVIYGSEKVLNALPDYKLENLPLTEGIRLLLNRGTGLLLAIEKLDKEILNKSKLDFIGRNFYKAVLACGDVFLIINKKYSSSVSKRLSTLEELGKQKLDLEDIDLYRKAVEFKFSPCIFSVEELEKLQPEIMEMFEKSCLNFFSICYNLSINTVGELESALSTDPFSKEAGNKEIVKNFIFNMIYMGRLDYRFYFSTVSPRLELLKVLLSLLFEERVGRGYTKFLKYWYRFN